MEDSVKVPDLDGSETEGKEMPYKYIEFGDDSLSFPCELSRFLVRPVYETFWKFLLDDQSIFENVKGERSHMGDLPPQHTSIISGQPGIGEI